MLLALLLGGCTTPSAEETTSGGGSAGRAVGQAVIGFYQDHVGGQWGYHCDFQPSCSSFGREAVGTYGLLRGSLLTFDRLMRDHGREPGYRRGPDGSILDPVADNAHFAAMPAASTADPRRVQDEAEAAEERPGGAEDLLEFAGRLFEAEDFERAGIEYRRHLFLFPDDPERDRARFQLAVCLSRQGRHEEALAETERLPAAQRRPLQAVLLRDAGHLTGALEAAEGDSPDSHLLYGMLALEAHEPRLARQSFAALSGPPRELLLQRTEEYEALPSRSPALAGTLSALLPGAGQFYSGRRADGTVAFMTNAVLIGGTLSALHNEEGVTAGLLGFFALGFYTGNVYGGVNAAHRFNRTVREQHLQSLRGELRQNRIGLGLVPLADGGAIALYLQF